MISFVALAAMLLWNIRQPIQAMGIRLIHAKIAAATKTIQLAERYLPSGRAPPTFKPPWLNDLDTFIDSMNQLIFHIFVLFATTPGIT
ncbi:MAG: hypothetical protein WAW39_07085 [Prosthecobacter sp.]|uniref:hypothetical protein n=1 Tax=Prosthecobacter sp. TaxID=1965333 RepID=UPI003BAFDF9F